MFKAISWGQFTGAVLVLLLLYYAYVGLAYYRVELMGLLKGRGNAAGPSPAPAPAASSIVGRGGLIGRPAGAPPTAAPQPPSPAPAPTEAAQPEEAESRGEAPTEELLAEVAPVEDLPALDLPAAEREENNVESNNIFDGSVDIKHNFTDETDSDPYQEQGGGPESSPEEFEPGFTIGIAQLGNYLELAAEGQMTREELAEQEPGLADTDLLVAFFQSSTKNAQRATSHLYADVAEPSLS